MRRRVSLLLSGLLLVFCLLFTVSCRFDKDDDSNLIKHTEADITVIPDKYNTGPKEGTVYKTIESSGYIAPYVYLTFRTDGSEPYYCLSSYTNKSLPDFVVIRNYDFSKYNFTNIGTDRYQNNKHITFINCKFKGFRNDAVTLDAKSRLYYTFNNCSFGGNVSSAYITLNNCKIGGFTSDATNPLREYYANNVYIYDLLHEKNVKGTHIDGVQIYGDQSSRNNLVDGNWICKKQTGEIKYNNVRFEFPSVNFEGASTYVNAAVMYQLEFSDVENVSFNNLIVNGGGKWYPIYLDHGKNNDKSVNGAWSHKNLTMTNVKVSDNFGKIFYPDYLDDTITSNIEHHSMLYVSSVWKDINRSTHIIVTNDTSKDRTLTVKSDKGTYTFEIPHCPSNWALNGEIDKKTNPYEVLKDSSGKSYTEYRWDDFPFDIDLVIEEDVSFVVCYDEKEQIRYKAFDGQEHSFTEIKE